MNKGLIMGCCVFLVVSQAPNAAPISGIDLKLITKPKLQLNSTSYQIAEYVVTNRTPTVKHLKLTPTEGVIQKTKGSSLCSQDMILKPDEKCLLRLRLDGQTLIKTKAVSPQLCEINNKSPSTNCAKPLKGQKSKCKVLRSGT